MFVHLEDSIAIDKTWRVTGEERDGFAKIDDVCCAFQKCGQTSCFAAVQLVNKSPFTEPYYL